MHFTKSILATSVLLAISASSWAANAQWVDKPANLKAVEIQQRETVSIETTLNENKAFTFIGNGNDKAYVGIDSTTYTVGEKANVWATSSRAEGSNENAQLGIFQANAGTFVNNGNIYLSVDNQTDWWAVKAAYGDGGSTLTNKGLIYVKNAMGMNVGSSGKNDITNDKTGVIVVDGVGAALDVSAGKGTHTATNKGTIILNGAEDAELYGIRVTDGVSWVKIYNSGTIIANGGTAIAVFDHGEKHDNTAPSNVEVNLNKGSHIEGVVKLNQTTTLNINEVVGETITLDTVKDRGVTETGFKLNLDNGSSVTIAGTENKLDIKTLDISEDSNTQFVLNHVAAEGEKVLTITNVMGDGADNIGVGYTGAVSDQLQAGDVAASDLLEGIEITEGPKIEQVSLDQGFMGDAGYVDANGFHATRTNDLLRSTQDLAITNALMWRSQLTNLTDRMGTLRTTPNAAGVWARYNNGRLDGLGIEHDYNTVEFGVDKRIADNVTIGFSFDYTKGDTDLTAGTSDNNTYTVGFYGSYFNESGCFLDSMLKIGRIDADYDLRTSAGKESADYMLTGAIFGIETGHRWNIQNYFIEPQVQLTYSHLRAENYTSSIGRDVKFDDMSSLIGRVGVMAGMQFAENRGAAYVKASYNHDFLGDVEGNYEYNGAVRTFDDELDDNWGEVSLGGSYQVTDSVNTFVDVGTGFGGDIDQKWRVNLGARYVF